jgi:putative tRNA adenosine deaminase-associated protein
MPRNSSTDGSERDAAAGSTVHDLTARPRSAAGDAPVSESGGRVVSFPRSYPGPFGYRASRKYDRIDFALAAYVEDAAWAVAPLPVKAARTLAVLVAALHQVPSESGVIGMVSVHEDYFVLLRLQGSDVRMVLSSNLAVQESMLAIEVVDALGAEMPEPEDLGPVGDVDCLADLGLPEFELVAMLDNPDDYPDELLGDIADRLGFGDAYDRAVDQAL